MALPSVQLVQVTLGSRNAYSPTYSGPTALIVWEPVFKATLRDITDIYAGFTSIFAYTCNHSNDRKHCNTPLVPEEVI